MTFKEFNSRLPRNISYKGICVVAINKLEIKFTGTIEENVDDLENGFCPKNKHAFNKDVRSLIWRYIRLSAENKKKAYIYIYYTLADYPLLTLGI